MGCRVTLSRRICCRLRGRDERFGIRGITHESCAYVHFSSPLRPVLCLWALCFISANATRLSVLPLPRAIKTPLVLRTTAEQRPIVVRPVIRIVDRIISEAHVIVVALVVRAVLALNKRAQWTQSISSVSAVPTSNGRKRQDPIVQSHPNVFVGRITGVVSILRRRVLRLRCWIRGRVGTATADDFSDQTGGKWCQVRQDEMPIWIWRILRQRWRILDVIQRCGG